MSLIFLCSHLLFFSEIECYQRPPVSNINLAWVTVYDPYLCPKGEACINGNGDMMFASMIPVSPDWYGKMAACPPELYGRTIRVLDMNLFCGDSFGTLNGEAVETTTYIPEIGWAIRVDVFWPLVDKEYPSWNAGIYHFKEVG